MTLRSQILSGSLISLQLLMTLCGNGSLCESGRTCKAKATSSCAQRRHIAELADRLGKGLEIGKVDGAAKVIAACRGNATERRSKRASQPQYAHLL